MSDAIDFSNLYIYHIDEKGNATGRTNLYSKKYEECSFKDLVTRNTESIKNRDTLELSGKTWLGSDADGKPVFGEVTDIMDIFKNAPPVQPPPDDLAVADFSVTYRFYPTGDPEQDRLISMGLDHMEKYLDFTNASDFRRLNEEQYEKGFDGMSKEDIYMAIYEKYQHCYGENFLDAKAIGYPICPIERDGYREILHDFEKELKDLLGTGNPDDIAKIRKKALYGNMNDADILMDIIDKYKVNGKITYEGMYNIISEADNCRLGGGIRRALNQSEWLLYNKTVFDTESYYYKRERLLDKPLTKDFLKEAERMATDYAKKGIEFYIMEDVYTVFGMIASEL